MFERSLDDICNCTTVARERYLGRISGPLLDRISIHLFVRPVEIEAFRAPGARGESERMFHAVFEARGRQKRRYTDDGGVMLNARLSEKSVRRFCKLGSAAARLLVRAQQGLRISARGRSHILRVARTIADLEGSEAITEDHVSEAVQYRMRDLHSGMA